MKDKLAVGILAGGLGTRLSEETQTKPKPMVEIGGYPILWHIMKHYGAFDFNEFYIALGYKSEVIKDYFLNYRLRGSNLTVDLKTGHVEVGRTTCENWVVHLMDTGGQTQTGGRIKRLFHDMGERTVLLTYGDGVCDVDIHKLLAFHRKQGKYATITAVRPPSRFGALTIRDQHVEHFNEKPQLGEGWINGGFFVLEPEVADYIDGDQTYFEREPLERLAREGQLSAYSHEGFWQCMDTQRDVKLLESLWQSECCPWKTW